MLPVTGWKEFVLFRLHSAEYIIVNKNDSEEFYQILLIFTNLKSSISVAEHILNTNISRDINGVYVAEKQTKDPIVSLSDE